MNKLNLKGVKGKDYKKVLEELQKRLLNYNDEEGIKKLLDFQRNFRQYSFRNTLLIYFQCPKATKVAGFYKWNKLGRRIKKGETGIRILAPCFRNVKYKTKEKDKETGEEKIVYRKTKQLCGFRFTSVFDISQTTGKEIPTASINTSESNHEDLFYKVMDNSPIPVFIGQTEEVNREIRGYFVPSKGYVKLSENLEGDNKLMVLIHELAHYFSFQKIESKYKDLPDNERRRIHEITAEGSAYIFFTEFGLDLRPSYQYLFSWTRGGERNVLEYGELIRKTANHLISLAEDASDTEKENIA